MTSSALRLFYIGTFLITTCTISYSQFTSGIEGTITDPSGAAVPNASVAIRNPETGSSRQTSTSNNGYYRFNSLPTATFDITVKAAGFETSVQEHVELQAAQVKTVNFALQIGATASTVVVTAAPPSIETSEGRISGLLEQRKVQELPLVGRNLFSLVILTPGVTGLPSGGGQSYAQATGDIFAAEASPSLNANGARGAGNNFMVDSASTNNVAHGGVTALTPNAEAVQEVRISANNFSAEFGRNSSIVVNVITKQGTNDFHGAASWFHTNNVLSSRNEFQAKVPVFRRNEGSAALGGPIWKNHTFFFGSVDDLRSGVGTGSSVLVETPQFVNLVESERPNSIASKLLHSYPASVPATHNFTTAGQTLGTSCNTLSSPSSDITSPIGPVPCNMPVVGEGSFAVTVPRNGLQWNTRIDHVFNSDKDRLYGNFFRTTLDTSAPSARPAFTQAQPTTASYFNLNETHILSPTAINELGASYVRTTGTRDCNDCEIPGIGINGLTGFGLGFSPAAYVQNIYELRDVVSLTRGSHNLKTGFRIEHNQDYDDFGKIPLRPNYSFNNVFDFANDDPFSQSNVGIDPRTGQKPPSSAKYISSKDYNTGIFLQDDWKVLPNLSLNLGLRWELFGNLYQRHNKQTNILFPADGDFTSRIANARVDLTPNHHLLNYAPSTWAPRFAFAWDPTKKGKMSVRGGAGIFYERLAEGPASTTTDNPPLIAVISASKVTQGTTPVYGLGTPTDPFGFPYPTGIQFGLDPHNGLLSGRADVNGVDMNLTQQRSYNWFFGIQRALNNRWTVEADYIGSLSRHEYVMYDVNRFAGDLIQNDGQLRRLNPSFGAMNLAQSRIGSSYNGMTLATKRRFGHGFSLDSTYTFGKTLDGSNIGGGGNEYNGVAIADINNLKRERGLAVFDVRNRFTISALWQIPSPQTTLKFMNGLLGGWQVSNVTILQSGTPYSVFCSAPFHAIRNSAGQIIGNSGCDYNADGFNYDYPNAPSFGNSRSGLSRSDYLTGVFLASDFPAPPLGQEGDLGRDTFRGPGFANTDVSISKSGRVPFFLGTEGLRIQFRTDFFNAFNRVNLTQVNGDLNSPQFGKSTSAFGARNIQFGLRLSF